VATQHQARGVDGAAGRPAAERTQGTSNPRMLVAAPAPALDQQPRLVVAAGAGGGQPDAADWKEPLSRGSCAGSAAVEHEGGRGGAGGRRRSRSRARGADPWAIYMGQGQGSFTQQEVLPVLTCPPPYCLPQKCRFSFRGVVLYSSDTVAIWSTGKSPSVIIRTLSVSAVTRRITKNKC